MSLKIHREPIERETPAGGITIREIEAEIAALYGETLSVAKVREKAFLFALLKQGSSLQKLQWFTGYEMDFIRERVEGLRAAGRLITNTPAPQFLQYQVPGCEALIERITGQRVVPPVNAAPRFAIVVAESNPKEEIMETATAVNGAASVEDFEPACGKTEECDKPRGHMGRCKGPQPGNIGARARLKPAAGQAATADAKTSRLSSDSPEERKAANATRMRQARAQNKDYGRGPEATTAANAVQATAAPVAAVTAPARTARAARPAPVVAAERPCHFTIEFEDETETIKIKGSDRKTFARKLKSLYAEFAAE